MSGIFTKNIFQRNEKVFNIFAYVLAIYCGISGIILLFNVFDWWRDGSTALYNGELSLDIDHIEEIFLSIDNDESLEKNRDCRLWNCLNLYRCGHSGLDRLTIYVYPLQDYVDLSTGKLASVLTREYFQIIETIVVSPYYTSNPNEACLFLPTIDMLNQNLIDSRLVNRALAYLAYWDNGENHLLFNMIAGSFPHINRTIDVHTDRAILASAGFDKSSYRIGFDISIPIWSPTLHDLDYSKIAIHNKRNFFFVVTQINVLPECWRLLESLEQEEPTKVFLFQVCDESETKNRCDKKQQYYDYPQVLNNSTFCLLTRGVHLGQPDLLEMLAFNCIPVIAMDDYMLPFEDVLDWSLASVRIRERELHSVLPLLTSISSARILEMQQHGHWLFTRYFKDLRTITMTVLEILEDRIFPHRARSLIQWNMIDNYHVAFNPLFLPIITAKSQGFTAVILTYDRIESLFTLIQKLSVVSSLQCILVIWNNQHKAPPHLSAYPVISKPIKVIQTQSNKLSNRFFPYAEIETEAILTIDDDIIMLTADELDFGFEVWREFPDRIVGFPSRLHTWDNTTFLWHYESEWTNQISMVLTGASFHHKFWSHMYTYSMPGDIKDWVDEHMNCEDIAMNFLVANVTNNPPIKVLPRKKFKCPECTNTEMLSADLNHMRERSACIDRFARIYGRMPLRSVEFRADPVLFKDNFPEKLKRFNDVGSL